MRGGKTKVLRRSSCKLYALGFDAIVMWGGGVNNCSVEGPAEGTAGVGKRTDAKKVHRRNTVPS